MRSGADCRCADGGFHRHAVAIRPPTAADMAQRSKRLPMNARDRWLSRTRRAVAHWPKRSAPRALIDSSLPMEAIRSQIRDLTVGRGADIVMDFAGHPEALELGVQLLRDGGRFVVAGATFPARPIQLSGEMLVKRLLQIIGLYNYEPEDLGQAITFLAAVHRRFPFAELVTRHLPARRSQRGLRLCRTRRPPRVAIKLRPSSQPDA